LVPALYSYPSADPVVQSRTSSGLSLQNRPNQSARSILSRYRSDVPDNYELDLRGSTTVARGGKLRLAVASPAGP
jgi:hypothetical protein